jgi:hypothetical protein
MVCLTPIVQAVPKMITRLHQLDKPKTVHDSDAGHEASCLVIQGYPAERITFGLPTNHPETRSLAG